MAEPAESRRPRVAVPERIATGRLVLRPFEDADVPALAALLDRWEVVRTLRRVPHPYGEADARAWIAGTRTERAAGRRLSFAAERRGDGVLIGGIGIDLPGGSLGYWVGVEHWGLGYATEMARAVVRLAFETLGLAAVQAFTAPGNEASARVLAKAGLVRRGDRTYDFPRLGGLMPAPHYRLTREQWRRTIRDARA